MIGEASIQLDQEYCTASIQVEPQYHENAPAFNEPTDHTNSRWPSYTSWADSLRFAGLYDLFFNEENGLMREHPGVFPLSVDHEKQIFVAIGKLKQKYPNAKAGYSPNINESKGVFEDPDWPVFNNYLVRLEWLLYWVSWALENCKNPVIYNQ